jgi:hypothetical protein
MSLVKNNPILTDKSYDDDRKTIEKIKSKKFIYQFVPDEIAYLLDVQKVKYKNKNLKSSYIIDLVNTGIFNVLIYKRNTFQLNSAVMRVRYGSHYNIYVDYLVDEGVLVKGRGYLKGSHSNSYSLNPEILDKKIRRYKNYDKFLLKKYIKRAIGLYEDEKINNNEYNIEFLVRRKMIESLFTIDIDMKKAQEYINMLKDDKNDIFNRNMHAIEAIRKGDLFYHFDNYGRMHTNFTVLRSFIRQQCLSINGDKLKELDIHNSQPMFLAKLIDSCNSPWVDKEELKFFKDLVKKGKYYSYIMDRMGITKKKTAKKVTYNVLFGKNKIYTEDKFDKNNEFKKIFPSIFKFITIFKNQHNNHKVLSYKLQRLESNLIFNRIVKRIMEKEPSINLFTVHDSISVPSKHYEMAQEIFVDELAKEFNFNI